MICRQSTFPGQSRCTLGKKGVSSTSSSWSFFFSPGSACRVEGLARVVEESSVLRRCSRRSPSLLKIHRCTNSGLEHSFRLLYTCKSSVMRSAPFALLATRDPQRGSLTVLLYSNSLSFRFTDAHCTFVFVCIYVITIRQA